MSWLETKELTLPSGKTVTVAHVEMTAAVLREVPSLTLLADLDTENPENNSSEQAAAMADAFYYIVTKSVLAPKFVLNDTDEDLDNDIIWIGRLSQEDIDAIIQENSPADELEAASNAATFQHGERSLVDSDSSSDLQVPPV